MMLCGWRGKKKWKKNKLEVAANAKEYIWLARLLLLILIAINFNERAQERDSFSTGLPQEHMIRVSRDSSLT